MEEIPEGTFPINLKLIQKHQRGVPSITAKYKYGMYQQGSFCGGCNISLKLIGVRIRFLFRQNSKFT